MPFYVAPVPPGTKGLLEPRPPAPPKDPTTTMVDVLKTEVPILWDEMDPRNFEEGWYEKHYLEVIEEQLKKGVDPNHVDKSSMSPLHWCAMTGKCAAIKTLVEAGANLEARNSIGETPLALAVVQRHLETARQLAAAGARLDVQNKYGETPLDMAKQFAAQQELNKKGDFMFYTNYDGIKDVSGVNEMLDWLSAQK